MARQGLTEGSHRIRLALHQWSQGLWHWYSRRRWWMKGLMAVVLLLLLVRSLPYLAPIRADSLRQNQQAVEFSDRNGLPLGTILTRDQDHTMTVPLAQVSPHFRQAIIAAEDQRFYQHGAVDLPALVRAGLEAIQARQVVSGASTITMQLARMIDPSPRTWRGKVWEIWTAWRLAAGMNKDEILAAYVNRLPMGGNVYGVEAAARLYFGLPAQDLTLAQASLLAGIPNDPNQLNPYDRWKSLKQRQVYVLRRLVQDGYISPQQADRTYAEQVALQPRQQGIITAPQFQFWLAAHLPPNHDSRLRTTLDRSLQQFVEAQVQQVVRSLRSQQVHHAAALVVDNHSGEVLAYVGSPDYFADQQMGRNDGVQALRQPGSTLKPFLYQLALENRTIRPNTILPDVPTHYAIPGARLYSPSDYSETFQGPVRVRLALANSLNVPAVRVLEKVGVPTFLQRLHQLGFSHLNQSPDYYGLGLALGSGEVSLWELAQAYVTLARQGDATALKVARDMPMPALERSQTHHSLRAGDPSVALITDMLSDAHARARAFGVDSLLRLPFPTAVKTGTSSDFRDTWTVGYTTDYTVAVWVGNFDGSPMQQVSGVMGAAPLWNRIMLHLHEQREPGTFAQPATLVQRPICARSGARPSRACPTVVQEYLYPEDLAAYERQPDPFYQVVQRPDGRTETQFRLPAEYNEWLARHPQMASTTASTVLKIVSPQEGDYFLMDAIAAPTQRLQFKLANSPTQAVEWRLNGQIIATQATPTVFWQPQPGQWTLQVRQQHETAQVRFQVQVAEARSSRRGFSYQKP